MILQGLVSLAGVLGFGFWGLGLRLGLRLG